MSFQTRAQKLFTSSWVPNTVSFFNLFSGFFAILKASEGSLIESAWFIFLALICDSLDGNIARAFKNSSPFGRELDSLSDMVSFVAAPVFLALQSWPHPAKLWMIGVAFLYLAAGGYRLARFNIRPPVKAYFEGLPTPAAAILIAMVVVAYQKNEWSGVVHQIFDHGFLILAVAALMVSRIPYPKLSAVKFSKWQFYFYLSFAVFMTICTASNLETAVAFSFGLFTILAPIYGTYLSRTLWQRVTEVR